MAVETVSTIKTTVVETVSKIRISKWCKRLEAPLKEDFLKAISNNEAFKNKELDLESLWNTVEVIVKPSQYEDKDFYIIAKGILIVDGKRVPVSSDYTIGVDTLPDVEEGSRLDKDTCTVYLLEQDGVCQKSRRIDGEVIWQDEE